MVVSAIEKMTKRKWKLTHENPTVDFNSLTHTFTTIDSRNTVTLTQPSQIEKEPTTSFQIRSYLTYLALLPKWPEAASIVCQDKLDSTAFLRPMGLIQWLRMTGGNITVLCMIAGMQNKLFTIGSRSLKTICC